jgi:hypothetical protein
MCGNQCVLLSSKIALSDVRPLPDRLITSKDHASVQLSIVDVDTNGRALPTSTTFALCGQVRSQGESDDSINRLATESGRESPIFFNYYFGTVAYVRSSPQRLVVHEVKVIAILLIFPY